MHRKMKMSSRHNPSCLHIIRGTTCLPKAHSQWRNAREGLGLDFASISLYVSTELGREGHKSSVCYILPHLQEGCAALLCSSFPTKTLLENVYTFDSTRKKNRREHSWAKHLTQV